MSAEEEKNFTKKELVNETGEGIGQRPLRKSSRDLELFYQMLGVFVIGL